MKSRHVSKEQWISMFRQIGLDEATMTQWHQVFEKSNPEGHQEFLEWLNIPGKEISEIRSM